MHSRYGNPTPCKGCRPESLPETLPYLQLYTFCSDQYIVGGGGAIGLNFLAVDRAMDYFDIDQEERIDFYEHVRLIASVVLDRQYKDQESKRKAAAKK